MPFTKIANFSGINNRVDPTKLGLEWQLIAQNTLCDNAQYHVIRPGYDEFLPDAVDAYGTDDGRLFVVTSIGILLEVSSDGSTRQRLSGFTGAPFQWTELGYAIFAMSESASWIIYPDRVVAWRIPTLDSPAITLTVGTLSAGTYLSGCILIDSDGRQGGCSGISSIQVADGKGVIITSPEVAGYTTRVYFSNKNGKLLYYAGNLSSGSITITSAPSEGPRLTTQNFYPPPLNSIISAHGSRICVSAWEPEQDRSILYWSKPGFPHLFDFESSYQIIAGKVMLLTQAQGILLIGTDRAIFSYQAENSIQQLSNYGALNDTAQRLDSGQIAFWTDQGLCRFPPFENITNEILAADNRSLSSASILCHDGSDYYIVAMLGDIRKQSPLSPYTPLPVTVA
jgi:hypothetical protein